MINSRKNQTKKTLLWLSLIFALAVGLRLPGVYIELEPYNYCDEDLYVVPALQQAEGKISAVPHFRSGGMNFIIPKIAAKAMGVTTPVTTNKLRVVSRIIANVVINALAVFLIYFSIYLLCKSPLWSGLGAFLYAISPFATAQSTWFYPDNYICAFSAGALYLTLRYVLAKPKLHRRESWALLAGIGAAIGATTSIKYSGVILFGYVGLALVIGKSRFFDVSSLWPNTKRVILESSVIAVTAMAVFSLLNIDIFDHFAAFVADASVKHYKIVKNPFHGWSFYGSLNLFFIIGVFPVFALLGYLAQRKTIRASFMQAVLLLIIPGVLVIGLGRYNLLFARNMQIGIPFLVVFTAVGMHYLYKWMSKTKYSLQMKAVILAAGMLTIIPRAVSQFLLDIQPDSRIQAEQWILENGYNPQLVYSNDGCSQAPIRGMASRDPKYILLDNWFGGVHRNGEVRKEGQESFRYILNSAHLRDLHYMNHLIFGWKLGFDRDKIHERYKPIKFFSGAGPGVVVYEKRQL